MQLDPKQAQALFDAGSFVLISGLPNGTEVSIDCDAHYTTQSFSGWKMIPPGLHLITYSPPTSSTTDPSSALSSGLSVRRGILRFLHPKQTVVLQYSEEDEELLPALTDDQGDEVESVVGKEHLMTMDKSLAPYPFEQLEIWKRLSSHITESDVRRILGRNGKVDALMEAEGDEVVAPESMRTPGLTSGQTGSKVPLKKERGPAPALPGSPISHNITTEPTSSPSTDANLEPTVSPAVDLTTSTEAPDAAHNPTSKVPTTADPTPTLSPDVIPDSNPDTSPYPDPTLHFHPFDLRRSWRKGATGEEVTRFSRDKSWAFVDVLMGGFGGDPSRLLAEFEISLILFLRLYNFSSLTAHKRLLSLISRSATSLLSTNFASTITTFFPTGSYPSKSIRKSVDQEKMISFYTDFVEVLMGQVGALPDDAFSKDMEGIGLEEYWIKELDELYRGVSSAVSAKTSNGGGFSFTDFGPLKQVLDELKRLGKTKFGWDLIDVDEYNRIMGEQEMFEEETGYLEEGEDAPVVVEDV